MSQRSLEERVAALEREVAELRAALANGAPKKDWLSTVGMFTGDEVMKRIEKAAVKYREADRRKARRRQRKSNKQPKP